MIKKITFLFGLLIMAHLAGAQVIWGDQPGEGDFDGGLNGWTTEGVTPGTDSAWSYTFNGTIGTNPYAPVTGTINSATASNGAMIFNYQQLVPAGQGGNPPYPNMTSHLTSPAIDISGASSQYLALEFTQFTRKFTTVDGQPLNGVSFSQDGGATWIGEPLALPDFVPIDASPSLGVAAAPINEVSRVNIPGNTIDITLPLQVRFSYAGNFYFWAVDDVKIVERNPFELNITNNPFFSIAPNYSTPEGLMGQSHGFLLDIYNQGNQPMTNTVGTVEIADASGTVVFTDNLDFGTLDPDTLAQNSNFPNFFPTDLAQGLYTGTYSVTANETESNTDNNFLNFGFEITDTVFAKENGPTDDVSLARNAFPGNWTWAYGTIYYVGEANGKFARSITFANNQDPVNNPSSNIAGEFLVLKLYEWNDDNDDLVIQPAERTTLGFATHEVATGEDFEDLITVLLRDDYELPVDIPLKDDTHYVVAIEYTSTDAITTMHPAISNNFDYGARRFQDIQVDPSKVAFSQFIGFGDDLSALDYTTVGFGGTTTPVVRLGVGNVGTAIKDLPTLADNTMTISPNPAVDFVNISIELTEVANTTLIEVIGTLGETIRVYDMNNVLVENKQFQVANLAAGTYYVRMTTENGTITKPFQVMK